MFETGATNHYQNNLNLCCQNDAYLYNAIKVGNSAKVEAELVRIQKQTDAQYNAPTGFDPSEYLGTPETRAEALAYCEQYWQE